MYKITKPKIIVRDVLSPLKPSHKVKTNQTGSDMAKPKIRNNKKYDTLFIVPFDNDVNNLRGLIQNLILLSKTNNIHAIFFGCGNISGEMSIICNNGFDCYRFKDKCIDYDEALGFTAKYSYNNLIVCNTTQRFDSTIVNKIKSKIDLGYGFGELKDIDENFDFGWYSNKKSIGDINFNGCLTFPCNNFFDINQNNNVDYDVVICIPSYNRYDKVKRLINQFHQQQTQYKFSIILLNDGSDDERYDSIENEFDLLKYIKNEKPNGKVLHWYCYNQMWETLKSLSCNFILQMDDDFILCDNFLDRIINLFIKLKIKNNKIMAISPHLWSFNKISKYEDWWEKTDFVDGISLIDRGVIEYLKYGLESVNAIEVIKKGVPVRAWTQIGKAIKKMNGIIHRTNESWVYHDGNDDSKLHGDHRKDGKCGVYTQKYIGEL